MDLKNMEQAVLDCLALNYGLGGTLVRLSGENLNYLLRREGGVSYVVKIVDDDMPPEVVEMENEALNHAVSLGFSYKLPKIRKNIDKKIETGITIPLNGLYRLRVISLIEGRELQSFTDISVKMMENVGKMIAELGLAMKGFDHPAAHRTHRWNLVDTGMHRDKISLESNPEKRRLLEWGFEAWAEVESTLHSMPWQFIHGDLNPENILVEGDRINGVVDFGDCCMNPAVCDLAISITYFMMNQQNPLNSARVVVYGYEQIRPLDERERSLLLPLVCGRLATSIAISLSRRLIDPHNPNWFQSEGAAWRLLGQMRDLGQDKGIPG